MALPTPVNDEVTDAVTQANVQVIGSAPAQSLGSVYQVLAQSTSILFENATAQQQNGRTVQDAILGAAASLILESPKPGVATESVLSALAGVKNGE
jgi:hypothetical protein